MKKQILIFGIALCMVLVAATAVTAYNQTEQWQIGFDYSYGEGEIYKVTSVILGSTPTATINVSGTPWSVKAGDRVSLFWKVKTIQSGSVTVERYESNSDQQQDESQQNSYGLENTITLKSGEVLLVLESATVRGAIGVSLTQAMNPTFVFWQAYRVPTELSVPVPDEMVTLQIGASYQPSSISSLTVRLEGKVGTQVQVKLSSSTSYTITKVLTPLGEQTYADLINQAIADALAQWEQQHPTQNGSSGTTVVQTEPFSIPAPVWIVVVLVGIIVGIKFALDIAGVTVI